MEPDFWQTRWNDGRIGFHQAEVNRRLTRLWPTLGVPDGATVFVPLCGKSLDMLWLHERGHPVLGVELSDKAVRAFFEENALDHERHETALGVEYLGTGSASGIRVIAGDFFGLGPTDVAHCDALYDRASLIAMNDALRPRYAAQLAALLPVGARGLLLAIDYEQTRMKGPPFAVPDATVRELLGEAFTIEELERREGPEALGNLAERGLDTLTERAYGLDRTR